MTFCNIYVYYKQFSLLQFLDSFFKLSRVSNKLGNVNNLDLDMVVAACSSREEKN